MITVYKWNGSSCEHGGPELLPESASSVTGDNVMWVILTEPTPEEESLVFEKFKLIHTLSLEDITRMRRVPESGGALPKVEEFPDYLFAIVNPLPPGLSQLAAGKTSPAEGYSLQSASRMLRRKRPQLRCHSHAQRADHARDECDGVHEVGRAIHSAAR